MNEKMFREWLKKLAKVWEERDSEAGGEKINEDKITEEVVKSLGISSQRLKAIWARVFSWQQEE